MTNTNCLSVIGLGKLGACTAACFASKGFKVIGIDINKDFVDAVNNGKAPVYEPRLQETLDLSKGRLRATQNYEEVIKESDITFLIVPTPSRQDGHFSDKYLKNALRHLALTFKNIDKKYHLFVVTSTVSPGTIEESLIPLIESVSEKKLNKHFGICYNPEFIALGSVIKDFLSPDMILIGESDKNAGDVLKSVYKRVCENKPYFAHMSIISAEITKLSLNCFITMKISFANTIANICQKIPNADVDAITRALGADKRVSPYYIKGGLSFGGPCFPRDNRAFIAFSKKHDYDAKLAKATDEVNELQINSLVNLVISYIDEHEQKTVSILGLTYKPDTPVIEESPSIKLIEELLRKDLEIIVYDSLAMENTRVHFGDNILYASSLEDCIAYAPICVITTLSNEFKEIDESFIVHNPTTIIDCWRMLDHTKLGGKVKYIPLGKAQK
jgi:UDPglucose 6-dehydrogenase